MNKIPEDLGNRYFEILHQDAPIFYHNFSDIDKSNSLLQKYKYRFDLYKQNALTFEDLFNNIDAPLVENAGNYFAFRNQVKSLISLIQNKLDNNLFSEKDRHDIWVSADKLDKIYFKMTGK